MELSFEQGRILGAMIEKAMTTPANYPMSLNAVVVACNQVSNREPITDYSEDEVELILRGLTDRGLAKMVHKPGDRVVKYRQALNEALETGDKETALVAVLMLRGPQTPGELRQRTARYVEFVSLPELEEALSRLAGRGLVERLERQPGQKESRYRELLTSGTTVVAAEEPGGAQPEVSPPQLAPAYADDAADPDSSESPPELPPSRYETLRTEFDELKRRFDELLDRLGEEIP